MMLAFIRLGRFLFLGGGVLLYALGTAIALYNGARFDLLAYVWGQITVTAAQLMVHYANEYFDFDADLANPTPTRWAGGSRVLPEGLLPRQIALWGALGALGIALGSVVTLTVTMQPPLLIPALLLAAIALAWAYSAPPFRLHSRGLGELAATLIVPGLTPMAGYALQTGRLDLLPVLAVIPLCCVQFAMILTIEFPDAAGDAAVNKRTLVVRLGGARAARLHHLALLTGYLVLPLLMWAGLPPLAAAANGLTAPAAAWNIWRMRQHGRADPARWNSIGFWSIALLMGMTGAGLLAFALLVGLG